MILLEDTRNPISKHKNIHDWCDANSIRIERTKLYVGDYTLPTNQKICIDTKADMQEVYGNVIQSHARFKAELLRAQAANIKLIILVEQAGLKTLTDVCEWENPRLARWKKVTEAHADGKMLTVKVPNSPPISSPSLASRMNRMAERYGVEWQFCDKADTGKRIIEILEGGKS